MNPRLYIICIVAVFALVTPVLADGTATVHGGVYGWDTFEPLENAVVEVNSTPSQSMLAKYALYSFELDPGDYNITARYYQNGTLIYSGEETIKIEGEGNYVHDLLLLPVYSDDLMGDGNSSEDPVAQATNNSSNVNTIEQKGANFSVTSSVLLIFALLSLFAGIYWFSTGYKRIDKNSQPEQKPGQISGKKPVNIESSEPSKMIDPSLKSSDKSLELEGSQNNEKEPDIHEKNEGIVYVTDPVAAEPVKKSTVDSTTQSETFISAKNSSISLEPKTESIIDAESRIKQKEVQIESVEKDPYKEAEALESELEEETRKTLSEAPAPKKKPPLPEDLQEIMDIIRGQGGRITQKNLRSRLKYSEGKVSLMLADLERRELIEKFKMGRGNVVVVKSERH